MSRKSYKMLMALSVSLSVLTLFATAQAARKNVHISEQNWTGSTVICQVMKHVLENKLDVPVKISQLAGSVTWAGMDKGDVDVFSAVGLVLISEGHYSAEKLHIWPIAAIGSLQLVDLSEYGTVFRYRLFETHNRDANFAVGFMNTRIPLNVVPGVTEERSVQSGGELRLAGPRGEYGGTESDVIGVRVNTDGSLDPIPRELSLEDLILPSWEAAGEWLSQTFGDDMETWIWGDLHRITFSHPLGSVGLLKKIFSLSRGPFRVGGSYHTVSPYSYNLLDPFNSNHGASQRHIFSASDWDDSRVVIPTGISGIPASDFYCNQSEMYIRHEYMQELFSRERVIENSVYKSTFFAE